VLWLGKGHLGDARTHRTPAVGAGLGEVLAGTARPDRARSRRRGSGLFWLADRWLRHRRVRGRGRGRAAVCGAQAAIGRCLFRSRFGGRGLARERLLEPANDWRLDRR
jgi:hypothetical protein